MFWFQWRVTTKPPPDVWWREPLPFSALILAVYWRSAMGQYWPYCPGRLLVWPPHTRTRALKTSRQIEPLKFALSMILREKKLKIWLSVSLGCYNFCKISCVVGMYHANDTYNSLCGKSNLTISKRSKEWSNMTCNFILKWMTSSRNDVTVQESHRNRLKYKKIHKAFSARSQQR